MDRMRLLLCRLSSDNLRGDGTKWENETKELLLPPLPRYKSLLLWHIDKETIRSFCLHDFMVDVFVPQLIRFQCSRQPVLSLWPDVQSTSRYRQIQEPVSQFGIHLPLR